MLGKRNIVMNCKLCVKWEIKFGSCKKFSLISLINSFSNYCLFNVKSCFKSMMHLTAIEKEEQEQVEKLGGKLQTEKDYCSK